MNKSKYTGLGIALGAAFGTVAGVFAGQVAIWLADWHRHRGRDWRLIPPTGSECPPVRHSS